MLTDAEYALKMSIPDVTEKMDENTGGYDIRRICEDRFVWNGHLAWKRALDHADYLNNKTSHDDHISFCVVKYCQDYYVFEKSIARKKLGIDIR